MTSTHVEIKAITPTVFDVGSLRGVVSLRWPYSTSQHTISIQLSDEDVRKRSDKGQVKLTFHGKAAKFIKDLPSLTRLELSAHTDAAQFTKSVGGPKDADYAIVFRGDVNISTNGEAVQVLDSKPVAPDTTPARTKRTWPTSDLKRSAPAIGFDFDDSWLSQETPDTKRKRYSSSFKFIDSAQVTPAKSTNSRTFGDENSLNSSQGSLFALPASTAERFSQNSFLSHLETPVRPMHVGSLPDPQSTGQTASPKHPSAQSQITSAPNLSFANVPTIEESLSAQLEPVRAPDQGTPVVGSLFNAFESHVGSAPPTPRTIPFMSLESATEQEDLYRKLRASAPRQSDAGSSMVADEDDETGNIAEDPKPTILERQSQIQEGILRRKIDEESPASTNREQLQDKRDSGTLVAHFDPFSVVGQAATEGDKTVPAVRMPGSTGAAYGNSNIDDESVREDMQRSGDPARVREASPSMTERGAAVQESVFRSKIKSSDNDEGLESVEVHSVKSSVVAEPAFASVAGSVHENREETMLDRQASVQETLFREKLDRDQFPRPESAGNLSVLGQAPALSSAGAVEVLNDEPTLLQQQNDVQEEIFRDKMDNQEKTSTRTGPASLNHMEVDEVAQLAHVVQDRPLQLPIQLTEDEGGMRGSDLPSIQVEAPEHDSPTHTIEAISEKADLEQALESRIEDEPAEQEAQEFLQIEIQAEPEESDILAENLDDEQAEDGHDFDDDNDPSASEQSEQDLQESMNDLPIGTTQSFNRSGNEDSSPILIESDEESSADALDLVENKEYEEGDYLVEEESSGADASEDGYADPHVVHRFEGLDDANIYYASEEDDPQSLYLREDGEQSDAFMTQTQPLQEDEYIRHDQDLQSSSDGHDPESNHEELSEVLDRHDTTDVMDAPIFNETALVEEYSQAVDEAYLDSDNSVLEDSSSEKQLLDEPSQQIVQAIKNADYVLADGPFRETNEVLDNYINNTPDPSTADQINADGLGDDHELEEDELHHQEDDSVLSQEVEDSSVPIALQQLAKVENGTDVSERPSVDQEATVSSAEHVSEDIAKKDPVLSKDEASIEPAMTNTELAVADESASAAMVPQDQLLTDLSFHEAIGSFVFDEVVDVLCLAFHPGWSKTKGPDYVWTATLMQPSGKTCRVAIFRPYKQSLPVIEEGNVLLLRNFKVLSFMRELYLRSQEDSAWAVISKDGVQSPGPPVEYTAQELDHAEKLRQWWTQAGHKLVPEKPVKRDLITLDQVKKGLFFDLSGEVVIKPQAMVTPFIIYVTDYSKASDNDEATLEPLAKLGLSGDDADCLFMAIELRLQDARYAFHALEVGDSIELKNVLGRLGNDDKVYGTIYPELSGNPSITKLD